MFFQRVFRGSVLFNAFTDTLKARLSNLQSQSWEAELTCQMAKSGSRTQTCLKICKKRMKPGTQVTQQHSGSSHSRAAGWAQLCRRPFPQEQTLSLLLGSISSSLETGLLPHSCPLRLLEKHRDSAMTSPTRK